jgi:hypothetical protein
LSLFWDIARCKFVAGHQLPPGNKVPTYTAKYPTRAKGLKCSFIETRKETLLFVKIEGGKDN